MEILMLLGIVCSFGIIVGLFMITRPGYKKANQHLKNEVEYWKDSWRTEWNLRWDLVRETGTLKAENSVLRKALKDIEWCSFEDAKDQSEETDYFRQCPYCGAWKHSRVLPAHTPWCPIGRIIDSISTVGE